MHLVRADLHVHTVLSPCGGLDMGAPDIIGRALQLGLGIVAVTDHNTTGNVAAVQEAARGEGLLVLAGLEIRTYTPLPGFLQLNFISSLFASNSTRIK